MFLKTFMVNVQNLVEGESQKKKIITLGSPLLRALLLIPIRGVALSKKCWEKQFQDFEIRITVGLAIILLALRICSLRLNEVSVAVNYNYKTHFCDDA